MLLFLQSHKPYSAAAAIPHLTGGEHHGPFKDFDLGIAHLADDVAWTH
jgi:hypothetical protein